MARGVSLAQREQGTTTLARTAPRRSQPSVEGRMFSSISGMPSRRQSMWNSLMGSDQTARSLTRKSLPWGGRSRRATRCFLCVSMWQTGALRRLGALLPPAAAWKREEGMSSYRLKRRGFRPGRPEAGRPGPQR